ncbi:hypothetical protein [Lactiplantibacillus fabifermentans]|uniref:Integral membrane protein n=2 Tax=Lactiplantibacillus fabifermentans TaxID=483011 RepID=A0A0R2NGA4_9LACO|nr:hypothetical protein [Lactiplantibacillus fabifermentans]ETY74268.1 hypothetical protein LFAB_07960 [Lactiplantibacillus fabifermentans T30PCM01]KRO24838.1 hypothetical protein DY78_GL001566 [Lactiplantibacillus fabifermentans DSM 21115]
MLKRSAFDALTWLKIDLGFILISIPIDWLLGRPLLLGLVDNWLVGTTGERWGILGLTLIIIAGSWLLFFAIIASFRWLNQRLARHDRY